MNRYNTESRSYTILHRFFVGGEVMTITPWLGLPVQEIGLVVGLANPDRLVFVQVNDIYPFLEIAHEVALEEDPGGVAFVGNALTGPWELGVALPGTDRVVFLAESDGQWNVSSTIDGGDQPASLVGIDLDGDAIRELVVANAGPLSGTLGIFRRQPDASYLLETVTLPEAPGLVAAEESRDYDKVFAILSGLGPAIDAFFDGVRVNAEEEGLRLLRHAFLREIHGLFAQYADFSAVAPGDK